MIDLSEYFNHIVSMGLPDICQKVIEIYGENPNDIVETNRQPDNSMIFVFCGEEMHFSSNEADYLTDLEAAERIEEVFFGKHKPVIEVRRTEDILESWI